MLKFQYISDIHLECNKRPTAKYFPTIPTVAPVLILAGDIGQVNQSQYFEFLSQCSKQWKHVILVAGNHEYYQSSTPDFTVEEIQERLKDWCSILENVYFLNKSSIEIDGVRFLGTTLWSSIPENHLYVVSNAMSDYTKIFLKRGERYYSKRKPGDWTPLNATTTDIWHQQQVTWLAEEIPKSTKPTVIVSHHAPHPAHLHKADDPFRHAYATDLTHLMTSPVVCWISGHTHKPTSFVARGTKVLCASNPKGRAGESQPSFDASRCVVVESDKSYICETINPEKQNAISTTPLIDNGNQPISTEEPPIEGL